MSPAFSGSGKSSLVNDILFKELDNRLHRARTQPGDHDDIEGVDRLDKVIRIDQRPIGRTPRSNPATYTDLFTPIRQLFAQLPESRLRGYKQGPLQLQTSAAAAARPATATARIWWRWSSSPTSG